MDENPDGLSRRAVLGRAGVIVTLGAIAPLPQVAKSLGLVAPAIVSPGAVVTDTLGGLVAYVVPGNDRYSRAQERSTRRPGGVAAGAVEALRSILDVEGAGVTEAAVSILNALAGPVLPGGDLRGFASTFAALTYPRKDRIVRTLAQSRDGTLRELGSTVPTLTAFLSYSEAGVLDQRTGRLTGVPVGWQLTGYTGVADIRAEFRGYYRGHRTALRGAVEGTPEPRGGNSGS